MKKIISFILPMAFVFFVSCNLQSSKKQVEDLQAKNDSLMQAQQKMESEVNDYFSVMNEIQENINKIKSTQKTIPINPLSENTPEDVRNQVKEDMNYLNEMIRTNQEELNNLRAKLKKSSFKLTDVEKMLAQLTKSLNEETVKVAALKVQLQQKDSVITTLNSTVENLGKNVDSLTTQTKAQREKIVTQTTTINTTWYAIGSKKELKENKIITSNGLFSSKKVLESDFNKNYFVKIDARNTKKIPLYSTSKVKILTNHPKSSYTLEKENENYVIFIIEPTEFWSVSKYLVVEVD
ncbi:MAG: hypothetical protein ACK5L7_04300 [Paludibacteraceae bacterium]